VANELLYSGATDFTLAEVLNQEVLLSLADRRYIGNHPALFYAGDLAGSGSTVVQVPEIGWDGADVLADIAENTAATETAVADASYTITVSRRAISRNVSELLRVVDRFGIVSDPASLARDAVGAAAGKLMDLLANVIDDFTATAGTTLVDLNLSDLVEAAITLDIANAAGRKLCLLHPRQIGDVQLDIAALAGVQEHRADLQGAMDMTGGAYRFTLFGDVDVFASGRVPTANSDEDRAGGMFVRGAIGWADASIAPDPVADAIYAGFTGSQGAKLMIEFERNSSTWVKKTTYNTVMGVSQLIDAAGVSVISDA
jgi:hypothetical protein